MKAHTQTFKDNLTTLGKEINAKVIYTIDGVTTELTGDELGSVTPHYEGNILKSVMKQVDIMSDIDIPLNTEINVQFGMKFDTEPYEYIDYGNYIVYSSEKQEDTNNYKIIAYDKMLYAMKDYEQLFQINFIDINDLIDGYVLNDGTFATYNSMGEKRSNFIKVEPNTAYTFKIVNTGSSYDNWFGIGEYTNNNTENFVIRKTMTTPTQDYITITTGQTTEYIVISARNLAQATKIALTQTEEYQETYPQTINNYIQRLCTKIGLTFANSSNTFANYDKEIPSELYSNLGYTYRDVLDELAQVTASTICINKDDELEVRYIKEAIANPRRGD